MGNETKKIKMPWRDIPYMVTSDESIRLAIYENRITLEEAALVKAKKANAKLQYGISQFKRNIADLQHKITRLHEKDVHMLADVTSMSLLFEYANDMIQSVSQRTEQPSQIIRKQHTKPAAQSGTLKEIPFRIYNGDIPDIDPIIAFEIKSQTEILQLEYDRLKVEWGMIYAPISHKFNMLHIELHWIADWDASSAARVFNALPVYITSMLPEFIELNNQLLEKYNRVLSDLESSRHADDHEITEWVGMVKGLATYTKRLDTYK
jgi:hypothetical protein